MVVRAIDVFFRSLAVLGALLGLVFLAGLAHLSGGTVVLIALFWVLPVFVGYRLSITKERDLPIPLAIFLSWIGVLFALALPPGGRRCPHCDERIRSSATVCRFCGHKVDALTGV